MKDIITVDRLKAIFQGKNYQWLPFNIIGIRTNDQTPDKFNDWICIVWGDKLAGIWECTTEPGVYWLKNPGRLSGTAILIPGQYLNSWTIGTHKGYPALVQTKPLKVWRDANKDAIVDHKGILYSDVQGLNIHRGHETWLSKLLSIGKIVVDKYSAGCQVFAFKDHFDSFMELCKLSGKQYFSYTLISEQDFK